MSQKSLIEVVLVIVLIACVVELAYDRGLFSFNIPIVKERPTLQNIEDKVASDAVDKYDIAKRNGTPIDAYVAASYCCAAFLQAKDEDNYRKWKLIEHQEAKRAHVQDNP